MENFTLFDHQDSSLQPWDISQCVCFVSYTNLSCLYSVMINRILSSFRSVFNLGTRDGNMILLRRNYSGISLKKIALWHGRAKTI